MGTEQGGDPVDDALPAYQYTPIPKREDGRPRWIRLAKLMQGKQHKPIQVEILWKAVKAKDGKAKDDKAKDGKAKDGKAKDGKVKDEKAKDGKATYTALSYVWGDPNNKFSIQVCGEEVPKIVKETGQTKATDQKFPATLLVTRNLGVALRYLRDESEDRIFWIDAICIDQTKDDEKTSQVRMMTDIYKEAAEVEIWLGPAEGDSDKAIEGLRAGKKIKITFDDEDLRLRRALDAILLRAYWTRAWVVQEIIVNETLKVRCGKEEVKWEDAVNGFERYSYLLEEMLKEERKGGEKKKTTKATNTTQALNTRPLKTISDLDEYHKKREERVKLLEILRTTRRFDATDPRDKIFSLLGLKISQPLKSADFEPDYKLSWFDVSVRLFKHCVDDFQKEGSLDIICESQPDNKSDFPTWLPNFAADNGMERWPCQKELSEIGTSHAKPKYSPDKRTLSVRAVRVAEIHKTTSSQDDCLATDDWTLLARLKLSMEVLSSKVSQGFWSSLVLGEIAGKELEKKREERSLSNTEVFDLIKENAMGKDSMTDELIFLNKFRRKSWHRRFAIFTDADKESQGILIGMVPKGAQKGDEVHLLRGCNYLVLLRRLVPRVHVSSFHFVGPCYVYKPPEPWTADNGGKRKEDILIL